MLINNNTNNSTQKSMQSSIGSNRIHYDSYNNRIKGFSSFSVLNESSLKILEHIVSSVQSSNPNSTRSTIRAFVSKHMLDSAKNNGLGALEAQVDISNIDSSMVLAYFGRNSIKRRSAENIICQEIDSISQIVSSISPTTRDVALARLTNGGYRIEQLSNPNQTQINQLLDLYNQTFSAYTFELNEQSVRNMFTNNNIVLVTISSQNQIVGSMVAEHAFMEVDSSEISLYELSDYATSKSHRGNGAMTAMQIEAINLIRSLPNGNDAIIYSENRAPWTPVSISSHKTGLMSYCGTLEQHCIINSDRNISETGNMENLHVFSATDYLQTQ